METNEKLFTAYRNMLTATAGFFTKMTDDLSANFDRYNKITDTPSMFHSRERVDAEDACIAAMRLHGVEIPQLSRWQHTINRAIERRTAMVRTLEDDLTRLDKPSALTDSFRKIYLNTDLEDARKIGKERLGTVWVRAVEGIVGSVDEVMNTI